MKQVFQDSQQIKSVVPMPKYQKNHKKTWHTDRIYVYKHYQQSLHFVLFDTVS